MNVGNPPVSYDSLVSQVTDAVRIFSTIPGFGLRNCGFFTILEPGKKAITSQIGKCPVERAEKYFLLSQEKAKRLLSENSKEFIAEGDAHLLSWESRDPTATIAGQPVEEKPWGKWGGAIRAGGCFISLSGLPELGGEAAMIYTAFKVGWLNNEAVGAFHRINNNEFLSYFPPFKNILQKVS